MKPEQKFDGWGNHWLVNPKTGKHSVICPYKEYVYFEGWVGCTDYYISGGGVFSPEEFIKHTAFME